MKKELTVISIAATIVTLIIGSLVTVGWALRIDILRALIPGTVTMKFNVAACFILSSVVLLLYLLPGTGPLKEWVKRSFSIVIASMGFITLFEYLFNINIGIDEFFFKDEVPTSVDYYAGRMSIVSAANLLLTGVGLLMINKKRTAAFQFYYLSAVFFVSLMMLLALNFITDIRPFIYMPVYAAIGFMAHCIAIYYAQPMLAGTVSFERKLVTAFSFTFILIIVIGIIAAYYSNRRVSTSKLIRHTNEVLLEAEKSFSTVKDIVSGEYGYIITGDPSYKDLLKKASVVVYRHVDKLESLTSDNTVQQARIDSLRILINKQTELSLQSVQLKKVYDVKQGKMIVGRVSEIIDSIKTEEKRLLAVRQRENEKSIASFYRAFVIFLSCVFVLLLIIFFTIRQNIRIRKRTELSLSNLNNELEQKVLERTHALAASEKQFRYTLDNMLEGAQIIGFDWKYIYVNDSLARHGKYPKEEMIGYTVMEKYPGIEQTEIFKVYQQCFDERVPIHLENEFVFPDKSKGWFELSFQPVPEGIFILSIDITERKKIQLDLQKLNEELEQKVAERTSQLKTVNKELEAFSYSISHDLRAPLRGIVGFTELLEEKYISKLDEEAKRLAAVIKNNSLRMGNLIDDLLAFSRMGRQDIVKNTIATNELVKEVIATLGNNNSNIVWNVHSLQPSFGDVITIRQVWINFISNAIKYSKNTEKPVIEIGSFTKADQDVFFIKDNGVGFDPKYKDKLFKVFQRLHNSAEFEGTGVGLAIVEKVISKHGGNVWVEAEKDKGACFYFSLPQKNKAV